MDWTDVLRCPKTGNRLRLDEASSILHAEHADVAYPVDDGIVDFCPELEDRIAASYDKVASRYDAHLVSSTIVTKMKGMLVWGRASDRDPVKEVLSLLPDSFDGVLLDVPVGTGVFTASLYRRYPNATIIGVDCSLNMLRQAQACFQEHEVRNVHLLKADVAALPIHDAGVGMILSMNGWHAFADKGGALAEMKRVLPTGGKLIACGYVKGARRRSDWFVRHFGVRHGYFTPPFFTAEELAERFSGFTMTQQGCDQYLAWFEAVKQEGMKAEMRPSTLTNRSVSESNTDYDLGNFGDISLPGIPGSRWSSVPGGTQVASCLCSPGMNPRAMVSGSSWGLCPQTPEVFRFEPIA